MNNTLVSSTDPNPSPNVLTSLAKNLPELTPQTRKAATYIIENTPDIVFLSVREMATAADVKPNTLVRMARLTGYAGYEDFRQACRDQLYQKDAQFPDRARWLQSFSDDDKLGRLYADMASAAMSNIENTFAATHAEQMHTAATAIVQADNKYILGVGINHTLARSFAYLADMALDNVKAIPRAGNLVIDDIARAKPGDVLLAMTFKPYRVEVLDAVNHAAEQGVTIIGISDSPASPLVTCAQHSFVVETQTPQFFTSTIATGALLETLMAFVVATASTDVINDIERFHELRHSLGIYQPDDQV